VAENEERLIALAAAGDEQAFAELVKSYQNLVYNTAYQISQNREDAFDISQDVFFKVFRSIKSFRGDCRFSTWIYKICQNTAKDHMRGQIKKKTISLTEYDDEGDSDRQIDIPTDSIAAKPEEALERSESVAAVRAAIDSLSEEHRTIIMLRDIYGFSYTDIAEKLGLEIGTVKSRINRARIAIKDFLVLRNFI